MASPSAPAGAGGPSVVPEADRSRRAEALGARPAPGLQDPLADRAELAELGPPPQFARLLVEPPLAQRLEQAAALHQLLEPAQRRADRLPVVDAHPQRHSDSLGG